MKSDIIITREIINSEINTRVSNAIVGKLIYRPTALKLNTHCNKTIHVM